VHQQLAGSGVGCDNRDEAVRVEFRGEFVAFFDLLDGASLAKSVLGSMGLYLCEEE
jgi:hypothetical protein